MQKVDGLVKVSGISCSAFQIRRTPAHTRDGEPEAKLLDRLSVGGCYSFGVSLGL
jgi:hypothetical protein